MKRCRCTIQQPDQTCKGGMTLFTALTETIESNLHPRFYNQFAAERGKAWERFNAWANAYLEHSEFHGEPLHYEMMHPDYQSSLPCTQCQQETRWILQLHPTRGTILTCGPCWEKERVHAAALTWKLERIKTKENRSHLEKVIGWVQHMLPSSELENKIEDQQMGFRPDTSDWQAYRASCGIVLADSKKPYRQGMTKEERIASTARYQSSVGVWPAPALIHDVLQTFYYRYDITDEEIRAWLEWDEQRGVSARLKQEEE